MPSSCRMRLHAKIGCGSRIDAVQEFLRLRRDGTQIRMHKIIALVEDGFALVAGQGVAELSWHWWRRDRSRSTLFLGALDGPDGKLRGEGMKACW